MLAWLAAASLLVSAAGAFVPEVLDDECEGEGCGCYQGYKASGGAGDFPIATVRPFALYERMSLKSRKLGSFKPGVKARPLSQKLVVEDAGRHVVKEVKGKPGEVRVGDVIDTLIHLGEGVMKA